jgi:hypothetical protein
MADMGPEAMLMDAGPNLRGEAEALANQPGRAQKTIRSAIETRDKGANQRLAAELDANFGKATVPSEVKAGIRADQKALSPEYDRALEHSAPVDTPRIVSQIDAALENTIGDAKSKLKTIREYLHMEGDPAMMDPSPRKALAVRHAIDDMLDVETLGNNTRRELAAVRKAVDDELTKAVPGIKEVDSRFAELARQETAVDRGQEVMDTGRANVVRPSELSAEIAKGAQPQGLQVGPSAVPFRLRQGARAEIERIVGTNANDIARMNQLIKSEGDWNRDKLVSLFGKDKADRIFRVLDAEKAFQDTSRAVTQNSATARRQATQTDQGLSAIDTWKAGGLAGIPRAIIAKVLTATGNAAGQSGREAAAARLAQELSSRDIDPLIAALSRARLPNAEINARRLAQSLMLTPAIGDGRR